MTDEKQAKTVADKLQDLREWRARTAGLNQAVEPHATHRWKTQVMHSIDVQIERLSEYPADMPLLQHPIEALGSDLLDPEEKFIILWQHEDQLGVTSPFRHHLIQLLISADEPNLDRCAQLWPTEVSAIRRWRTEPDYATRMRGLPINFDL